MDSIHNPHVDTRQLIRNAGDILVYTTTALVKLNEDSSGQDLLADIYKRVCSIRFPMVLHSTDLTRTWREFRENPLLLDVITESTTRWILELRYQGLYDAVIRHTVLALGWYARADYVDLDYRESFSSPDQIENIFRTDPWVLYLYYIQQDTYRIISGIDSNEDTD